MRKIDTYICTHLFTAMRKCADVRIWMIAILYIFTWNSKAKNLGLTSFWMGKGVAPLPNGRQLFKGNDDDEMNVLFRWLPRPNILTDQSPDAPKARANGMQDQTPSPKCYLGSSHAHSHAHTTKQCSGDEFVMNNDLNGLVSDWDGNGMTMCLSSPTKLSTHIEWNPPKTTVSQHFRIFYFSFLSKHNDSYLITFGVEHLNSD